MLQAIGLAQKHILYIHHIHACKVTHVICNGVSSDHPCRNISVKGSERSDFNKNDE